MKTGIEFLTQNTSFYFGVSFLFFSCSVTVVLPFPPLLWPAPSTPLPQSMPPTVCAHESSIHVRFYQYSAPSQVISIERIF